MSIYESAMRKEAAGARGGISRLINYVAPKLTRAKKLAGQHIQDFKDQRYLYNRFGLKDYLNGTASYLSNTADAGKFMKALAVGSVAGQKALPYAGLTALGGGLYLLGDKIVDEHGNIITDEAQAKLRGSEADYKRAMLDIKKSKAKAKAESDNYLKYGLTGGGAVLGGLTGAGIAGEGNRILGGIAGAGVGAGAGYGAYRIAKYLELA